MQAVANGFQRRPVLPWMLRQAGVVRVRDPFPSSLTSGTIMRLQQSVMSGPRVAPLKYLSETTRETVKLQLPFWSPTEGFSPGKSGKNLWMQSLLRSPSRATTVISEGTKGNLFILLLATRTSRRPCMRASVEALLPCKGGARFDCPVFVKCRPLERARPFSIFALFVKCRAAHASVHVCRMDAMTCRMRFSILAEVPVVKIKHARRKPKEIFATLVLE